MLIICRRLGRKYGGALLGAAIALSLAAVPVQAAGTNTVHRVVIENFAFVPATVEVAEGDTVEWINQDIAPHTATQSDALWDTGTLIKGQTVRVLLSVAGTMAYFCAHHPNMRGTVIVTAK